MRRIGAIIILFLLLFQFSIIFVPTTQEAKAWWNLNWYYRKKLTISNAVNEYQMKIKVYKEDGHDNPSAGTIDTEGHCKDDFGDIRFTDMNDNELSYWIEEKEDGNYAVFWVKLPSNIESQSEKYIYMYYGNPSATTTSDGENTFLFFDDFNVDDGTWTLFGENNNKDYEITNGYLHLPMLSSNDPGPDEGVYASANIPDKILIRARMKVYKTVDSGLTGLALSKDDPPTGHFLVFGGTDDGQFGITDWGFDESSITSKYPSL